MELKMIPIEKVVLLHVDTNDYHAPNILLRGTKYRIQKRLCSNTLKRKDLNGLYFHEGNNPGILKTTQVRNLVHDFFTVVCTCTKSLKKAYQKLRARVSNSFL